MTKAWLAAIVVLVVALGGIFGGRSYADRRAAAAQQHRSMPPVTVSTAVARDESWSPETDAAGSLRAVQGTEITTQIAGNVVEIAFESGARVRQGQLLVRLDDTSQLAQLHADQARLALAQATLERTRKLYADRVSSQLDLQTAEADRATAQAAVEGDQALLNKLRIAAPFAGVVGIREVSLGQYVPPGTTVVNLQSWNPLLLDFSLPQGALAAIRPRMQVSFAIDAYPQRPFAGHITAVGSRVDPTTRNIALQATLDNASGLLRPGMYGHVKLALGQPLRGVAVPSTAIASSTFGDTVYVVAGSAGQARSVHAQVVQLLAERDGVTLLGAGLAAGDTVVTVGQNKLRDGMAVTLDNAAPPGAGASR